MLDVLKELVAMMERNEPAALATGRVGSILGQTFEAHVAVAAPERARIM
jgi:hypothetical protein